MNARQKAKKYKQELERLKKEPVKRYYVSSTHREVKTFRASEICYLPHSINCGPDEIDEFYKRILLEKIVKDDLFREAVKFQKETDFTHPGNIYTKPVKYSASVDVLI